MLDHGELTRNMQLNQAIYNIELKKAKERGDPNPEESASRALALAWAYSFLIFGALLFVGLIVLFVLDRVGVI